jgi:hypothetical protein
MLGAVQNVDVRHAAGAQYRNLTESPACMQHFIDALDAVLQTT